MYNCIYFVSKPEIGLHILSHLKPENFEKQKNKNQYSGTLWEGPQVQNQTKHWKKTKKIHDKTVVSHCCLHRPPFMCIYPRQRLMYDIPVDIGHMAPVTPPALWGSGEVMFLVWPLPATPPMSPRTPEGPPPTEAFLPGTPPGPPPPTPPLCVTL